LDLVAEILPVLVALYLVDSAMLVRTGQVLFVSGWGGVFEALGPGLRLPGLLPFAETVLGASLPLCASADGVLVPDRGAGERLVRFDSMRAAVADGGAVRLGGAELKVSPHALAPVVAAIVERLRTTPRQKRLARLRRELRRRVDPRTIGALRSRSGRWLRALRLTSVASFVAIFVLLPASLVPELPRRPSPLAALVVVLVLYAVTLTVAARLLLACGVRGRRLFAALLPLVLFPPAAAHAPSIVLRELYLGFEPAALARALLPAGALDRFERRAEPPVWRAGASGHWDVETLVQDLVGRSGRLAEHRPAPSRTDPSAQAFCPRCLAEYRAGFDRCSDCDVELVRFDARPGGDALA
jgi:hypothetical protein